jgi:hypothetical protein
VALGLKHDAEKTERDFRNLESRRERFMNTGWELDKDRNVFRLYKRFRVTLVPSGSSLRVRINGKMGSKVYAEEYDAAFHAFKYIESLQR